MQTKDRRASLTKEPRRAEKRTARKKKPTGFPPAHVGWSGRGGLPPHINLGLSAPVPIAPRQPMWRKPLRPFLVAVTKAIHAFPPAYKLILTIFGPFSPVRIRLAAYVDPEEAERARARLEREAARKHAEQIFASKPPILLSDATLYQRVHGQLQALASNRNTPKVS